MLTFLNFITQYIDKWFTGTLIFISSKTAPIMQKKSRKKRNTNKLLE